MEENTKVTEEVTENKQELKETFKTIDSQEALDAIIKDRLSRERKKGSEVTAGLQSELEASKAKIDELSAKVKDFDSLSKERDELKKQVKKYETDSVKTRISLELGIPTEMASRLRGETEEEIKADAEILLKSFPTIKRSAPQKSTESILDVNSDKAESKTQNDREGLMSMLEQMNEARR